jgi:hypothetical protein
MAAEGQAGAEGAGGAAGVAAQPLAVEFPGPPPGSPRGSICGPTLRLENDVLAAEWSIAHGHLRPVTFRDKLQGIELDLSGSECFSLVIGHSPRPEPDIVRSSEMAVVGAPILDVGEARPDAGSAVDRLPGLYLFVTLAPGGGEPQVHWTALLHQGANYLRFFLNVWGCGESYEVTETVPLDLDAPGAEVAGTVDGSPILAGPFFMGVEHPRGRNVVEEAPGGVGLRRCRCSLPYLPGVELGRELDCSAVLGVAPPGQMRRAFLHYLERERAHPHRPFLHYNNGSEIGTEYWKLRLNGAEGEARRFRAGQQALWLDLIAAFGRELTGKRGVVLDGFAHDYGWDDELKVWRFHEGYPDGFAPARGAANALGAHLGVWFSPDGGYPCKPGRMEGGREQRLEVNSSGLASSGPNYRSRLRAACRNMVLDYDVAYLKFDGFGMGNNQPGAGERASDVDALLALFDELRDLRPDVFINASTGSWPSPFWLLTADCIWRQGADTHFEGKGSDRQRWITYRDSQILAGTLARGPLFPVPALMIHGVFINDMPLSGNPYDPSLPGPTYDLGDIRDEVRSYFATGVALQELYINPARMSDGAWDALAEAARWARAKADILADSHWIGGDPAQGEVYGFAAWRAGKGILALRNPDDAPASITVEIGLAFELPEGAPGEYVLASPWAEGEGGPGVVVAAGRPHILRLAPFEAIVLEARPVG